MRELWARTIFQLLVMMHIVNVDHNRKLVKRVLQCWGGDIKYYGLDACSGLGSRDVIT